MLRTIQLVTGLLLLLAVEILRVYFIMPFPGSQRSETIGIAYFLHSNMLYFRIICVLIILLPVFHYLWYGKRWQKVVVAVAVIGCAYVIYLFNFEYTADKMFLQPVNKVFATSSGNTTIEPEQIVLGVSVDGKAKAYPIQMIGYHHQVRDTIAGNPLMITYCTVCRTGRVFRPVVNGKPEVFSLVGMDHFNAMFEDETTGTWWRQVNGEAIVGPLKGSFLEEVPASQMTLRAWLEEYPDSEILQHDTLFAETYTYMKPYEKGKSKGGLTRKDSLSWNEKSWIVGVQIGTQARAYDWHDLLAQKVINDTLNKVPIVIALESDSASFHVWKRDSLTFQIDPVDSALVDTQTRSKWDWRGKSTAGALAESRLPVVQSYQEYWHSWKTFRPHSSQYKPQIPGTAGN